VSAHVYVHAKRLIVHAGKNANAHVRTDGNACTEDGALSEHIIIPERVSGTEFGTLAEHIVVAEMIAGWKGCVWGKHAFLPALHFL
jgi:hypothetical protein